MQERNQPQRPGQGVPEPGKKGGETTDRPMEEPGQKPGEREGETRR